VRRRPRAEVEAIALVSEALFELGQMERSADDLRIVGLAQAIGALELGAFEAVPALMARSRTEDVTLPAGLDRAHAIVRALAVEHLRARFLHLAAGGGATAALVAHPPSSH